MSIDWVRESLDFIAGMFAVKEQAATNSLYPQAAALLLRHAHAEGVALVRWEVGVAFHCLAVTPEAYRDRWDDAEWLRRMIEQNRIEIEEPDHTQSRSCRRVALPVVYGEFYGAFLVWCPEALFADSAFTDFLQLAWKALQGAIRLEQMQFELDKLRSRFTLRQNAIPRILPVRQETLETFVGAEAAVDALEFERGLGAIIEQDIAGVIETDLEGHLLYVNNHFCEIVGYSPEELSGRLFQELLIPEDAVGTQEVIDGLLRHGRSAVMEKRCQRKGGEQVWVCLSGTLTRDPAGKPFTIVGVVLDITQRKQAEEALRDLNATLERKVEFRTAQLAKSEARFRAIFEQAPMGVALIDSQSGQIHEANARFVDILGRSRQEIALLDWMEVMHSDDLPENADSLLKVKAGESLGLHLDKPHIRPDGSAVWISITIAPVTVEAGERPHYLAMVEDITERKEAEERLRSITDAARDAILMMDPTGAITYWNPAAEQILGYRREEVLGKNLHCLLAPARYHADYHAAYPEFALTGRGKLVGKSLELFARRRDGQEIPVLLSLSAVSLKGAWHAVGIIHDITERKRSEMQLREAMERVKLAAEVADIGIWSWNFNDDTLEMDDRISAWYGGVSDADRKVGRHREFWRSRLHPDDLERADAVLEESLQKQKAGNNVFRIVLPDGKHRVLQSAWIFEHDTNGKPVRMLGVNRDITEQRELQENLLAAKQAAEAANQSKSEFLANMSHEVRTPTAAIISYADMLLDPALPRDEASQAVQAIRRNGSHLLAILNDILDLSKVEAGKLRFEPISYAPWQVALEVESLLRGRAEERKINLVVRPMSPLPSTVLMDPTRVRQVLMNLVSNAVKFSGPGSQVEVRVGAERGTSGECLELVLEVEDQGIGMSHDQLEQIFQPFQQADTSTTRRFGGTGLGLSISRRLVEAMGGVISVRSELGRGSCFTARVPLKLSSGGTGPASTWLSPEELIDASAALVQHDELHPRRKLAGRVLLAEDSEDNRRVLLYHLKTLGLEADVAPNGLAALEAARSNSYGVILMDMQMPELDGYQATRALRRSGYRLPIVALTAHATNEDRDRCLIAGCDEYLTKPVNIQHLADTLAFYLPTTPESGVPASHSSPMATLTSPGEASTGQAIPTALQGIKSTFENDPQLRPLILDYAASLPRRVAELRAAVNSLDFDAIESLAHQTKGVAGMYGYPVLTELASLLEQAARESQPMELISQLVEEFAELTRQIAQCIQHPETGKSTPQDH